MTQFSVFPNGFLRSVSALFATTTGAAPRAPRNSYTPEIAIANLRAFRG